MVSSGMGGPLTGARPVDRTGRPLDASMSLLREITENPLDPEYQEATARRRPRSRGYRIRTAVLAVLAGLMVTFAVLNLQTGSTAAADDRAQLEQEVQRRSERVDQQRAANEALQAQIAAAQSGALSAGGNALVTEADRLAADAGEASVKGPGLELTLDDAPTVDQSPVGVDPRENQEDEGRVLDRDLQIVVNGLWAAGAEAISVNGQRLTSLSAIRSAGLAILVDFRPLVRPYVVRAIGDPSKLQSGFAADMAGPYLQSLKDNYGVSASTRTQDTMTLPGAGPRNLREAVPVPSATPSASGSASSSPSPSASSSARSSPSGSSASEGSETP